MALRNEARAIAEAAFRVQQGHGLAIKEGGSAKQSRLASHDQAGYLPAGRVSIERPPVRKDGRYQGAACHFFRHVQKRELPGLHFACGVFIMGIKADVKDFLTVPLSQWRGLRSAA